MNLTDLTEVLRDRAAVDAATHDARMAGIRGRVLARRRRVALTGVVGVVLALVGVVYVALPGRGVDSAEPPRSLPEYLFGVRVVAQVWGDLPTTSVTLEYTPESDDLALFVRCVTDSANDDVVTFVTVNGRPGPGSGCDGDSAFRIHPTSYGGAVGKPFTVTLTVGVGIAPPEDLAEVRPPDGGEEAEFAVGLGEPVPR